MPTQSIPRQGTRTSRYTFTRRKRDRGMPHEVDWAAVLSGAGVFLTTVYITWKGWQDRKKEIEKPSVGALSLGMVQDQAAMRNNTEALRDLTVAINRQCDLLLLEVAITKLKKD